MRQPVAVDARMQSAALCGTDEGPEKGTGTRRDCLAHHQLVADGTASAGPPTQAERAPAAIVVEGSPVHRLRSPGAQSVGFAAHERGGRRHP